jgi:preprotein translocase subunit SecD
MRRAVVAPLIVILLLAGGGLAATVASGTTPHLGLDLQGGASVVLQPKEKVKAGALDQAIEIIRSRVDALGVSEPDISRQGNSIIVQLPGVKNQKRALEIVGQTAQLLFRPVLNVLAPDGDPPSTTRDGDEPTKPVVLPDRDRKGQVVRRYQLGPAELTGRALSGAQATVHPDTGEWQVEFELNGQGSKSFDQLGQRNFHKSVAIDLDGEVKSAPRINAEQFHGRGQITGDFGEREAKNLALVLRYGSLPIHLEPQTVQTVSASIGKDSLSAGLVAGAVGLALVSIYMVLYYRALGIVVWLGLAVSGALLYSIVALLGHTNGLALSLAGVTGIIASVGVTVDSYVVYFERLKDEIRSGRTLRSSVDRGFRRAYRTILAADAVSFIGALLLYLLSVGPVRGFAFFLGLSTLLDVVVAYFFTRPLVALVGQSHLFTEAHFFGVARGSAPQQGTRPLVSEPQVLVVGGEEEGGGLPPPPP